MFVFRINQQYVYKEVFRKTGPPEVAAVKLPQSHANKFKSVQLKGL